MTTNTTPTKLLIGAALLLGAAIGHFALTPASSQAQSAVGSSVVGRYQLYESRSLSTTCLLDTATGNVKLVTYLGGGNEPPRYFLRDVENRDLIVHPDNRRQP